MIVGLVIFWPLLLVVGVSVVLLVFIIGLILLGILVRVVLKVVLRVVLLILLHFHHSLFSGMVSLVILWRWWVNLGILWR